MFGFLRRKVAAAAPPATGDYSAYAPQFDREAAARQLLSEARAGRGGREKPPAWAIHGDPLRMLREPSPPRSAAELRALKFQTRWREGHALGDRPLITLLIDHSGSMRGLRALVAAITADVMGDILGHERVDLEVLGFTTSTWRGGQSRELWKRSGRPPHPGRLCDLLHIVYRDAAMVDPQSWQRDLALLLEPEVLKENVDGEALLWARHRAERLSPSSWLCMLISDGVPMDDSTVAANGGEANGWYLIRHLQRVVDDFNANEKVRLGCLALDWRPDAAFRSIAATRDLSAAPAKAFDLLEAMIWPTSSPKGET